MSHTDDKMNPIHFGSYPADLRIDRTGLIRIWITDEILVFVECAFFECFCCIRFTVDVHKHTRMLWFLSLVITLTRDIDTANLCRFVCPSIRPLRSGILWKRLNLLSWFFFHRTVARSFQFYQYQTSSRNSDGVTPAGALNTGGV